MGSQDTVFQVRRTAVSAAALVCGALLSAPALAVTSTVPLSFSSSANVYGYFNTSYSSELLGNDVSFQLYGKQVSSGNWQTGGVNSGLAEVDYRIASGGTPGTDPVYDIITSRGQYGMGYAGQAEVSSLRLKTVVQTTFAKADGTLVNQSDNTYLWGVSTAQWNQDFYVAPTANHRAGSYGALLIGLTLDGSFSAPTNAEGWPGGYAYASLQARSTFRDSNTGSNNTSDFYVSTSSGDASWDGASTLYRKVLFQYGTKFSLNLWQYAQANGNATADFFHTGQISSIEVPFEAALESGAQQLTGSAPAALYGTVFNSATLDDPNTNWDFGSSTGGGFTPNVPEPQTWAMLLAGVGLLGWRARRQRDRA